jgi:hypothetical protein
MSDHSTRPHEELVTPPALIQTDAQLNLVHCGQLAGLTPEAVHLLGREVRDTDGTDAALLAQADHRAPGLHETVLFGHRPVDQVQVDGVEVQGGGRPVERSERLVEPVLVVGQLRREYEVGALHAGATHPLAYGVLVLVAL